MSDELFAADGGLYLGYESPRLEGPPPETNEDGVLRYTGDRHVLSYGSSGAGKSRRLVTNNLLLLTSWSILCIDIKGELAAGTMEHRRQAGSECFLLNPYGVGSMPTNGWNPVAALPIDDDLVDAAQELAEAIIRVTGNDPHWAESAQEVLCALILYSRLTGPNDGSLGHVRELLAQPSVAFAATIGNIMEAAIRLDCEEMGDKAGRFMDVSPDNREIQSILSTAVTQCRWLDSRPLKRDLDSGRLDFSRMREYPTTVYAVLPANRLSKSSWLRLVITGFLQAVLKDGTPPSVPMLLLIDEAAQIGELPLLRDSIALLRSYGCKVWMVWQDTVQHKTIAGPMFESAVANSGVLLSFAAQEMTTARFLSDRAGQTTVNVPSFAAPLSAFRGKPADASLTIGQAGVPLMLPQEFINMDEGFAVIFSHKTKGVVKAYLPDPSEVESFDRILRQAKPPRKAPARKTGGTRTRR